ncbi:MAG: FGGY family carbohydrate kinase, partial [Chloroflexota bacterium]
MGEGYILAIDQGTTGTRAVVVNRDGRVVASAYRELVQQYPQAGWVEQGPEEIWRDTLRVVGAALAEARIEAGDLSAIGIANQRETTVLWDRNSGEAVHPAIVWQCRRTAPLCDELKQRGLEQPIKEKTGLVIDAYFSGTKLMWLLDNVAGVRSRAQQGDVLFGTVDSWLLWKLTGGQVHITDYTNASRTMLFDIHRLAWDEELIEEMGIP